MVDGYDDDTRRICYQRQFLKELGKRETARRPERRERWMHDSGRRSNRGRRRRKVGLPHQTTPASNRMCRHNRAGSGLSITFLGRRRPLRLLRPADLNVPCR